MLRESARESRAFAEIVIERSIRLRSRVKRLDYTLLKARGANRVKRQLTLRDEALDALRQSLHDLESLRLVKADEPSVSKLKADIRTTLERAR